MADFGDIGRALDLYRRSLVYFFPRYVEVGPTRHVRGFHRSIVGTPHYPENYWRRELVLDNKRGALNLGAGSDRLFRAADETTTALDPDGWRWNQAAAHQFRYWVASGHNKVTIQVKHNRALEPTPQVRILAAPQLGIAPATAAASLAVGNWQALVLEFDASQAGFITLALEWGLRSDGQRCVWKSFTLQP